MIDPLLDEAKEGSRKQGYVSVSYIQRMMRIGYTRAARLVDSMVESGFCEAEFAEGKGYRSLKNCPTLRSTDAEKSATSQAVFEAETLSTSDGSAVTARRS